ncbi:hypothetical protein [Pseudomonas putida]|uniref:hypothetical protein n=1 Tax=Pseudomonas putida TaxID=303 RepID=UPI00300F0765
MSFKRTIHAVDTHVGWGGMFCGSADFSQFLVKDLLADGRLHTVAGAPELSVRSYLAFPPCANAPSKP